MSESVKYRQYFNINPEYFPQVNEKVISENPDLWKTYYPHETFVKLIKDAIAVLERKQKVSLWVEGAYGTGKSHAVLTLKKLLDASSEETEAYFNKYPDQLGNDLLNEFQHVKAEGRIITVHRYGSSNIHGDNDLVFAMQDSISKALKDNGIEWGGISALKKSVIAWLDEEINRDYFNKLITQKAEYKDIFGGVNADQVISDLKTMEGDALLALMNKISKVAQDNQIKAFALDPEGLTQWIAKVIEENHLKAIVFFWDEFTEYFENNLKALSGFQQIVDLSSSQPFYMVIIAHKSAGLFSDTDRDKSKILDRFMKPTCNITLPENMAFQLMGAAMEKTSDLAMRREWENIADDLYNRTTECRDLVKKKANISDEELKNIIPIHPYAALLLKYISSAFSSNQRSMFDFIKNDQGDEIQGFQWFIDNYGPEDMNPLLTIDMLWDFFYEKGRDNLTQEIRVILDSYSKYSRKGLNRDEERVLKTVLLLQAISETAGDAVELLTPNEKNLTLAFDGTDLDSSQPASIANSLCQQQILYKKPMGNHTFQFSVLVNAGDTAIIDKNKEMVKKKTTTSLVSEGQINEDVISLTGALKIRYIIDFASVSDFAAKVHSLKAQQQNKPNNIFALAVYAKNDIEAATLSKSISDAIQDGSTLIFIDTTATPLGNDAYEQYVDAMAHALYWNGKDNDQTGQYQKNAKSVLSNWRDRITSGDYLISYKTETGEIVSKERVVTAEKLSNTLLTIDKRFYPASLEAGAAVISQMWVANSLKQGAECGAMEETKGSFRSANPDTKLEKYLEGAWKQEKGARPYWEVKPRLRASLWVNPRPQTTSKC